MPHVREVTVASHDRHDLLLVAALAAGDLTGTDRDQALALTSSCAECAALHDDLVAIARATVSVPPPIASSVRDFRLTPAQAASLGRTGWRRFLSSGGAMPLARPLGAALATLGIAGLLIGTQPLGFSMGSSASAPAAGPAAVQEVGGAGSASSANDQAAPLAAASAAAASAPALAPVPAPAASAAASIAAGTGAYGTEKSAAPSSAPYPDAGSLQPARGTSGGGTTAGAAETAAPSTGEQITAAGSASAETTGGLAGTVEPPSSTGPSPLILVSLVAVVVGVLLVVSSYRGRRTGL
jgi:hypothetical protein